jgi:hypothetical protein
MKRIYALAAIVLALGGLAAYLLWRQGSGSLPGAETAFALEDSAAVRRILLERVVKGREEAQVELRRDAAGGWALDGRYPAFAPPVRRMLRTLSLIHVREPLRGPGEETALRILRTLHTRIRLYDGRGRLLKSYLLGTEARGQLGSLMMLEGARRPYIVELPGHQGYINGFFPLEVDFWRENELFYAELDSIAAIGLRDGRRRLQARLAREAPGGPWRLDLGSLPDSAALRAYLAPFVGKIYAESFAGGSYPGLLDQLRQKSPDRVLTIEYFHRPPLRVYLFERGDNPSGYFGWREDRGELLTVQRFVIDKFLALPEAWLRPADAVPLP